MRDPKSIIIFANGISAVFDQHGEQIGELQEDLFNLYFKFLESKGVDIMKIATIETIVNGSYVYLKPFKIDNGNWNCEIVPKLP